VGFILHLEREIRHRARRPFADHQPPARPGDQPAIVVQPLDAVAEKLAVEACQALGLRGVAPQVMQATAAVAIRLTSL